MKREHIESVLKEQNKFILREDMTDAEWQVIGKLFTSRKTEQVVGYRKPSFLGNGYIFAENACYTITSSKIISEISLNDLVDMYSKGNTRWGMVYKTKTVVCECSSVLSTILKEILKKQDEEIEKYVKAGDKLFSQMEYAQAVEQYKLAFEYKYHPRAVKVAECYAKGVGVEKNIDEAIKYYQWHFQQEKIDISYDTAYQFKKDGEYIKALAGYLAVLEKYFNSSCAVGIGILYQYGNGVEKNYDMAEKWYQKAIDHNGDKYAKANLAFLYKTLHKEAEKCNAILMDLIENEPDYAYPYKVRSYCYRDGFGVEKDYDNALYYMEQAREKGLSDADAEIAYLYIKRKDARAYSKAYEAAQKGNAWAHSLVGLCYKEGCSVKKDYAKAFEWYQKYEKLNRKHGLHLLARFYRDGLGMEVNLEKAFEYYSEASSMGYNYADAEVGRMYIYGLGVERDVEKGFEYLKKSVDLHKSNGLCYYGCLLAEGYYVEKDPEKAISLLFEAAEEMSEAKKYLIKYVGNGTLSVDFSTMYQITEYAEDIQEELETFSEKFVAEFKEYLESFKAVYKEALWIEKQNLISEDMEDAKRLYELGYGFSFVGIHGEAVIWYKRAAELNYPPAVLAWSDAYRYGKGQSKNIGKAVKILEDFVIKNNLRADGVDNGFKRLLYNREINRKFTYKNNKSVHEILVNLSELYFSGYGALVELPVAFNYLNLERLPNKKRMDYKKRIMKQIIKYPEELLNDSRNEEWINLIEDMCAADNECYKFLCFMDDLIRTMARQGNQNAEKWVRIKRMSDITESFDNRQFEQLIQKSMDTIYDRTAPQNDKEIALCKLEGISKVIKDIKVYHMIILQYTKGTFVPKSEFVVNYYCRKIIKEIGDLIVQAHAEEYLTSMADMTNDPELLCIAGYLLEEKDPNRSAAYYEASAKGGCEQALKKCGCGENCISWTCYTLFDEDEENMYFRDYRTLEGVAVSKSQSKYLSLDFVIGNKYKFFMRNGSVINIESCK